MYPTRNMDAYMSEIRRLFPESRNNEELSDIQQYYQHNQASSFLSPTFQPTLANQSSSSTDSTSPESYTDLSRRTWENTFAVNRQRPIVGRKIVGKKDLSPTLGQDNFTQSQPFSRSFENDLDLSPLSHLWKIQEESHSNMTSYTEAHRQMRDVPEKRDFGFRTPVKTQSLFGPSSNASPTSSSYSPTSHIMETSWQPRSLYPRSNFTQNTPPSSFTLPQSPINEFRKVDMGQNVCTFCRKNGETAMVYMDHTVRAKVGDKNIVTCPILRSHVCSTCGGTGDNAHTITYCPLLRRSNNGQPLQSTTITLKNTRVKSNGRRRWR